MDTLLIVLIVLAVVAVAAFGVVALRRRPSFGEPSEPGRVEAPPEAPDLRERLGRSRRAFGEGLRSALGRERLDDGFWEELEEALIGGDVGVPASSRIVGRVRERSPADPDDARRALREEMLQVLEGRPRELVLDGRPAVVMVVGVNGTGKTTSIAKLATRLQREGREPLLGSADTFRAGADAQLRTWADRVGADVVGGEAGADPAAVAFDAYAAARARARDVVIIDTAGRLHSKRNLMAELAKIRRVVEREAERIGEVLLVLDATAGQNGVAQASQFLEAAGVTGIVLTKLDGTARGGIVLAIEEDLGIPVKLIGIGESPEDLVPFDPEQFVDALLADVAADGSG